MLQATADSIKFCQTLDQASSDCMPIGSMFDKVYVDGIDWETASNAEYARCNAREDFIIAKLCELHSLPMRRPGYSVDELAQLATPEQQATIWNAMLDKFASKQSGNSLAASS